MQRAVTTVLFSGLLTIGCLLAFSPFDTRDLGTSQPKMNCGTHTIVGAIGKYGGITGRDG